MRARIVSVVLVAAMAAANVAAQEASLEETLRWVGNMVTKQGAIHLGEAFGGDSESFSYTGFSHQGCNVTVTSSYVLDPVPRQNPVCLELDGCSRRNLSESVGPEGPRLVSQSCVAD